MGKREKKGGGDRTTKPKHIATIVNLRNARNAIARHSLPGGGARAPPDDFKGLSYGQSIFQDLSELPGAEFPGDPLVSGNVTP